MQVLHSEVDSSVNFVLPADDGGYFEARFVQRTPETFIVYLSSHSGCNKSCRFCHLTATGQTNMLAATLDDYIQQANLVFDHYDTKISQTASMVHFNFMARGEPLLNPVILDQASLLYSNLAELASARGLHSKFKLSSIIPTEFDGNKLSEIFADRRAMLYYSLYSVNPTFRKKWIPKAMPVDQALQYINIFQSQTGRDIAVHGAYILGQNDSTADAFEMVAKLNSYRIRCKFNIVRYNPYDSRYGEETNEEQLTNVFKIVTENIISTTRVNRIIPRVGPDVKASCGTFVDNSG